MNHLRRNTGMTTSSIPTACHPEQSKDPYNLDAAGSQSRSFRIVVRFFDESDAEGVHGAEYIPVRSSEAASFVSPGHTAWVAEEPWHESRRGGISSGSTKQ